jgi:hypothetical protein
LSNGIHFHTVHIKLAALDANLRAAGLDPGDHRLFVRALQPAAVQHRRQIQHRAWLEPGGGSGHPAGRQARAQLHAAGSKWPEGLTGTLPQLEQVWKAYHVYVQAIKDNIDHEPAIYLITPDGREQSIFLTQMAYTATDQQAQVLADATAAVLPGHPHVKQSVSLRYIPGIKPTTATELPVAGGHAPGRTVRFGPGHAHLVVFFATWVDENTNLTAELLALNGYQREALAHGWPQVVAVDEASTETTPSALPTFLSSLHGSLGYPVVIDKYGALSDGYNVQDQPWIELVSSTGKILFSNDGWFPEPALTTAVRKAMS